MFFFNTDGVMIIVQWSKNLVLIQLIVLSLIYYIPVHASVQKLQTVPSINLPSHSAVECIVRDSLGFIWVGTKYGLNRYDGYQYLSYKYDPKEPNSISNNEISCLAIQGNTYLWIGTRGGGVNSLNLKNGVITRYNNDSFNGLINDVAVDAAGDVWMGTSTGLLKLIQNKDTAYFVNVSENVVYRKETGEPFIPRYESNGVRVIYPTRNGDLLIGSDEGIFKYNDSNGEFILFDSELHDVGKPTVITEDTNGTIWIGSYNGIMKVVLEQNNRHEVYKYNSKAPKPYNLKSNWIEDIAIDHEGKAWIAIHGYGIAQIEDEEVKYVNDDLGMPFVKVLYELYLDETGIMWVGSENASLLNINLKARGIKTVQTYVGSGANKTQISCLEVKGKEVLVGTQGCGIEAYIFYNGILNYSHNIPVISFKGRDWSNEIKEFLIDDDTWIGFDDTRLTRLMADGKTTYYDTWGFIFTITKDHNGNIWYGTWGNGFGYIKHPTGAVVKYLNDPDKNLGLSSSVVLSMKEFANEFLLVGTKGGGLNIAPIQDVINRKGKFDTYVHNPSTDNSICHNDVFEIFESSTGDIWLGTGRGINRIIPSKKQSLAEALRNKEFQFQEYTEKDGLPGGIVYKICEDSHGDLWLGTNRGVCRLSVKDNEVTVFRGSNEFPSNSFENFDIKLDKKTGYLFLSNPNGITYFHPDSLYIDAKERYVQFTYLEIQNQRIEPESEINGRFVLEKDIAYASRVEIRYDEKMIAFGITANQYSSLNKVKYAYRLLGYDDVWIEVDEINPKISYMNLDPGSYTLQVKASNSDGFWSNQIKELKIQILPPYWLTTWAYLFYSIVLILLLLIFRRYSIIAVEQKNQMKIKEFEQRKEVELSEAKIRFFTNVSHEIRTPLTLIYEPLNQLLSSNELPDRAKEMAQMVMRNMKRLLNQVNQLLELRKIDSKGYSLKYSRFAIRDLIAKILYEFEVIINSKKTSVTCNITDSLFIVADRQILDTVIYNLISNALKFVPMEHGMITIDCVTQDEDNTLPIGSIKIRVSDNGPGISEPDLDKVFGYFYQTKEVEKSNIGGTGIGLAIVREYIELHKGTVKALRNDEGGSCFELILPINDNELQLDSTTSVAETTDSEDIEKSLNRLLVATTGKNLNMVVVEDDMDLAQYLRGIFSNSFNVVHFADGKVASDEIKEISPDIILCDLMLPGLNGMDLTAQLKSSIETSHIPIIMLTAKAEDESKIKGLEFGADSYLIKPFNTRVLIAQVGAIIKSRDAFKERFSKQLVLEPARDEIVPRDELFIKKIMELTENRLDDSTFEVTDIVKEMGMSHTLLLKKFKSLTGMALVEFVRSMRIKKAKQLFKQDKFFVADVAYMVGFSDPKYFSKCFTKEVGISPSDYIKKYHPE